MDNSTPTAACLLSSGGMWEKIGSVKWTKLVGWDKDNQTGKEKSVCTSKENRIHSPLPMGGQVFIHPQMRVASSHRLMTWKGKHHHSKHSPFSFSSSSICWAWHHVVWDSHWASWGQLSCSCPLQLLLMHSQPAHCRDGWVRDRKALTLCNQWSVISKKPCGIVAVWPWCPSRPSITSLPSTAGERE